MTMALVGNIQDFGLSDFLYLVDRGYKTGCLHLNRENEMAILFFEKGKLTYAALCHDEKLTDFLVQAEKLTPEQAGALTQAYERSGRNLPMTQVLLKEDLLPQEELQRTLQTHVEEEVVYSLFGWPEGAFRFEHGQKPEFESPILPTPLSIENLIMEGVRRIDEWGRIRDRIPSTDLVARFVDQPGEKAKGVKLAPEEWRVFARINGKDTMASIAKNTNLSECDVCRIMYGFATAGLVDIIKKPTAAQLAQGAQDQPKLRRSLVSRIINRIQTM